MSYDNFEVTLELSWFIEKQSKTEPLLCKVLKIDLMLMVRVACALKEERFTFPLH